MAAQGDDPIGSMGTDTPLAVLSDRPRLLYDYFKQNFAQVTNPPIDPIREAMVMSLVSMIGPRPNLLGHQAGTHKRLEVSQPILTNEDLEKIRSIHETLDGAFRTQHARRDLAGRRHGPGARGGAPAALLGSDRGGARRHQRADPLRPRRPGRTGCRSRPRWRPARSTTT